ALPISTITFPNGKRIGYRALKRAIHPDHCERDGCPIKDQNRDPIITLGTEAYDFFLRSDESLLSDYQRMLNERKEIQQEEDLLWQLKEKLSQLPFSEDTEKDLDRVEYELDLIGVLLRTEVERQRVRRKTG